MHGLQKFINSEIEPQIRFIIYIFWQKQSQIFLIRHSVKYITSVLSIYIVHYPFYFASLIAWIHYISLPMLVTLVPISFLLIILGPNIGLTSIYLHFCQLLFFMAFQMLRILILYLVFSLLNCSRICQLMS